MTGTFYLLIFGLAAWAGAATSYAGHGLDYQLGGAGFLIAVAIALSEGQQQSQINLAPGDRESAVRRSEGERQANINRAQGEAEAIRLVADATAAAISVVAGAITKDGGVEAINLKVAERYVEAFEELAKATNTLIVPSNMGHMATLVSSAMKIVDSGRARK